MLQKRFAALLADMKTVEREHMKARRKQDIMQKERDAAKSELSKLASMRDKLEKLSRETSTENRKLRVSFC